MKPKVKRKKRRQPAPSKGAPIPAKLTRGGGPNGRGLARPKWMLTK